MGFPDIERGMPVRHLWSAHVSLPGDESRRRLMGVENQAEHTKGLIDWVT